MEKRIPSRRTGSIRSKTLLLLRKHPGNRQERWHCTFPARQCPEFPKKYPDSQLDVFVVGEGECLIEIACIDRGLLLLIKLVFHKLQRHRCLSDSTYVDGSLP